MEPHLGFYFYKKKTSFLALNRLNKIIKKINKTCYDIMSTVSFEFLNKREFIAMLEVKNVIL